MKFPWTRSKVELTPVVTGRAFRSVPVQPNEARLITDMVGFSNQLAKDFRGMNDKMVRSYDAALTGDFDSDFTGTYGNANTEIFSYFYRIWARVRKLATDTPHGKAIVRSYKINVVGHDPFSLTMRLGETIQKPHPNTGATVKIFQPEEDNNRTIEREWKKYCRHKNFTIRKTMNMMEALSQVVSEAITIGSVIIRKWDGFPGNKYGFAIDILESDRLQPNFNGKAPETGNPIRASIERHPVWDYPIAYWILTRHPGEFVGKNYPGGDGAKVFRERVPAENIIHYNNLRDRAEQDLGFTELEACVRAIHLNFQYAKALTMASVASCCKPWVIEKDTPTGLQYTPSREEYESLMGSIEERGMGAIAQQNLVGGASRDPSQLQQGLTPNRETLSPAATKVLEWGFKMKVLDPKFPVEAAHEFRLDNNKEIATASGVSYSDMTGDYQSLGYIAAQMSMRPSRDNYMMHQANVIDVVILEVFEAWLKNSINFGVFDFDQDRIEEIVDAAYFKGKRWPFTDPLREEQALILAENAGHVSPQGVQEMLPDGRDYADVVAERGEAKTLLEAYDLPISAAPTEVAERITETGAIPGDGPPDEPTDPEEPQKPNAGGGAKVPPKTRPAKPVAKAKK